jgi:hypothetical protein
MLRQNTIDEARACSTCLQRSRLNSGKWDIDRTARRPCWDKVESSSGNDERAYAGVRGG